MEESTNNIKNRNPLWYELPLIFTIFGGIVAYFKIKNDDPKKARNCLIMGDPQSMQTMHGMMMQNPQHMHGMMSNMMEPMMNHMMNDPQMQQQMMNHMMNHLQMMQQWMQNQTYMQQVINP